MWCGSICDSALRLGVRSTEADFFLLQIAEVNVVENFPQPAYLVLPFIFARVRSRALFNKERGREGYVEMWNSGITPALSASLSTMLSPPVQSIYHTRGCFARRFVQFVKIFFINRLTNEARSGIFIVYIRNGTQKGA